jgi:hypothetical protein
MHPLFLVVAGQLAEIKLALNGEVKLFAVAVQEAVTHLRLLHNIVDFLNVISDVFTDLFVGGHGFRSPLAAFRASTSCDR